MKIHSDRAGIYRFAGDQQGIEGELTVLLNRMAADSQYYSRQLLAEAEDLNVNRYKNNIVPGKIYRAWTRLRVTFPGCSEKAIIASCLHNEEVALHAYSAALHANIAVSVDTRRLVEAQEDALRKAYTRLGRYRETPRTIDHRMSYFIFA